MLLRFVLLSFYSILVFGSACPAQNQEFIRQEIASYLDQLDAQTFNGAILVAHRDSILEKWVQGMAHFEYEAPLLWDTKFNIASITKMFTAVATLQLVQAGKLELHMPIARYLPDYPNKALRDSVHIHHLLTHTAGTRPFFGEKFKSQDKLRYRSIADFLPLFAEDTLAFSPGSDYLYNGAGFVILGLIIEQVSGQNYYDYLQEHIFEVADMPNTIAPEIHEPIKNRATGYTKHLSSDNSLRYNYYMLSKAAPSAGYYSTVEDLFHFMKALRNGQLLHAEMTKLMFAPKVKGFNTHLGYGIDVDQRYSEIIRGHGGGWYGVRGEVIDFEKSGFTIVLLSNVDDGEKTGLAWVSGQLKEIIAGKMKK